MTLRLGVRQRLTLIFVLLAGFVYLTSSGIGLALLMLRMDNAINQEISAILDEVQAACVERNGVPVFVRPRAGFNLPLSVQLYDLKKGLVEEFGLPGVSTLHLESGEFVNKKQERYLSKSIELKPAGRAIGYAQVQVSLIFRDQARQAYTELVLILSPLVLIGLALVGNLFAGWAIRPIEQALSTLRSFLSDAGHELGTPIAIMRNTAENLSLDLSGIPDAEERVDILIKTSERMSALVKDMMLLATLENPELPYKKTELQFDELVLDCVNSFRELYATKNLYLHFEDLEKTVIDGNKSSLERVINNLLQNALKYTEEGGVDVRLVSKDAWSVLTVADTGIGIPSAALPNVLNRFYRVDTARSREKGGFGLGLAIAKACVDAHGGTIKLASIEGKGTTVTISLPPKRL